MSWFRRQTEPADAPERGSGSLDERLADLLRRHPVPDDTIGTQPEAYRLRWEIAAQMRLHPELGRELDVVSVWNGCHRPWMAWFQADRQAMLAALERDSRGLSDTDRLGAYELAVEWYGADVLDHPGGRVLFTDAMSTLAAAGLGRDHLRMFEMVGM